MRGSEARDLVCWFCGTFEDPWNNVFTAEKGKFDKGGCILVKKANHGCNRGVTRSVDSLQHHFNTRLNISTLVLIFQHPRRTSDYYRSSAQEMGYVET
jgi:hypothetical protein